MTFQKPVLETLTVKDVPTPQRMDRISHEDGLEADCTYVSVSIYFTQYAKQDDRRTYHVRRLSPSSGGAFPWRIDDHQVRSRLVGASVSSTLLLSVLSDEVPSALSI